SQTPQHSRARLDGVSRHVAGAPFLRANSFGEYADLSGMARTRQARLSVIICGMRSSICVVCACAFSISASLRSERVAGSFPEKVPATFESPGLLTSPPSVAVLALPDGGIQPQAVVDTAGITHV